MSLRDTILKKTLGNRLIERILVCRLLEMLKYINIVKNINMLSKLRRSSTFDTKKYCINVGIPEHE